MARFTQENVLMEYNKNPKFCLMPFITLNTRPNGQVKPCSQVMGMKPIKVNSTVEDVNTTSNRAVNLTKDSVEDIWNSDFMRDFRMKKINGEYIKYCETCYQEDSIGNTSKRQAVINRFYEENKYLVDEAHKNNGYMHTLPVWWELRLSSICNQACRMCIPQTSSKMREEFAQYIDELPKSVRDNTEAAVTQYQTYKYLGDNDFFLEQFWNNIQDIRYLELHGGEPTADKNLWSLIEKVVSSGHSKHIHVHVHTNIHSIQERHVDLWDNFKSGWIGVSIDAYNEENEYIRYGSKWDAIERNLKLLNRLGNHWAKWISSSVMAYNACTMHRLIEWFLNYKQTNNMHDLFWRMDPVVNPNHVRVEHVPLKQRKESITHLLPLLDNTTGHDHESIMQLIKVLESPLIPPEGSFEEFVYYTKTLDKHRNQNVSEVFPHLKYLFV